MTQSRKTRMQINAEKFLRLTLLLAAQPIAIAACGDQAADSGATKGGNEANQKPSNAQPANSPTTTHASNGDFVEQAPPPMGELGDVPGPLELPALFSSKSARSLEFLVAAATSWTEEALPALVAALLEAGYTIRNGDEVLYSPEQSNGLAMQTWELQAAKALLDRGFAVSLNEFAATFNTAISDAEPMDLRLYIADAVSESLSTDDALNQTWGQLLVEFGRRGDTPHDWTSLDPDLDVMLSAPELLLITTRLRAEMYALAAADTSDTALATDASEQTEPPRMTESQVSRPASAPQQGGSEVIEVSLPQFRETKKPPPCTLTEEEALFNDKSSLVTGEIFSRFSKYVAEHGLHQIGEYAELAEIANAIGAYVKLAWTALAFKSEFRFDKGEPPLIRNKDGKEGEYRDVVVSAELDFHNAQIINCISSELSLLGVDFTLSNAGPVTGAEVVWRLYGNKTVNSQGVAKPYLLFDGNPISGHKTDENGESKITVKGAAMKPVPKQPKPVRRRALIRADYVLSPADLERDAIAIAKMAKGGLLGLTSLPVEMLFRSSKFVGGTWAFGVQDWTWGSIHYEEYAHLERELPGEKASVLYRAAVDYEFTGEAQSVNQGSERQLVLYAKRSGHGDLKATIDLRRQTDCSVEGGPPYVVNEEHTKIDQTGSFDGEESGGLEAILQGKAYQLEFSAPSFDLTGPATRKVSADVPDDCYDDPGYDSFSRADPVDKPFGTRDDRETIEGILEQGDAMQGSKEFASTIQIGGYTVPSTITVTWDLQLPPRGWN